MIAEARRRLDYNKQCRMMKYVLSDVGDPRSGLVQSKGLRLAAEVANMKVPEEIIHQHATLTDRRGAPKEISWRPLMSNLPPPELRGPGGFEKLPMLKRHRLAALEAQKLEAAKVEAAAKVEKVVAGPPDKEVVYWFKFLQSKLKDRFTEVRRAFRILDEDFSGFLNRDEFKKVMDMFNLGDVIPDPVFTRILSVIDKDNDGTVKSFLLAPTAPLCATSHNNTFRQRHTQTLCKT
jgi:hypothetical protein